MALGTSFSSTAKSKTRTSGMGLKHSVQSQGPKSTNPTNLVVTAVLALSLLAPMQASAMGGGGASSSSSSGGSSLSPSFSSPSFYSPSFSTYSPSYIYSSPSPPFIFSSPPFTFSTPHRHHRHHAKHEVKADEKEKAPAAGWFTAAAVGGVGVVGASVLGSDTRASKPVRGRSKESILAERRNKVDRWPGQLFSDLRPPQGAWAGTYTEGRATAAIQYVLTFNYAEGTFSGSGSDIDGKFVVEDGVFSPTGHFIWTQRSKPGSKPLVVECVGSACDVKADGICDRPTSLDGDYKSDAGYQGRFSISPAA